MASTLHSPTFYTPLNPKDREIRVLSINPNADADSEIVCKVEIRSLNESASYNALSYCWGAEDEEPVIEIEGEKLAIKPNLFTALSQLRDVKDTVRIWVDALCIDQSNIEEKESQVSMMGLIYQHAELVYAWLGEEADGSADAMALLQILQINYFGGNVSRLNILKNEFFITGWRALIPFLRRPYWTRAWIMQEILLAGNVMLCCGRHQVAWPTLCLLISEIVPKWCLDASDSTSLISSTLENLHYLIHDPGYLSRLSVQQQKCLVARGTEQAPSTGLLDLLECLTMSRWRFAKDKRDHIYSVLSLTGVTYLTPNYRNSTEWLFREVVIQDIEARRNLDILSGCKHFVMDERNLETFSEVLRDELGQNDLLAKDLASLEEFLGPSPTKEVIDIGQHPIWYEKSAQFLENSYELLRKKANDPIFGIESSHTITKPGAKYSLEVLSYSLGHIRQCYQREPSNAMLHHVLEFNGILRCFLNRHRQHILDRLLNASLPTWAANWTLPILSANQNILLRDGSRGRYRAGGNTAPRVKFDEERQKMFITALVLDKVTHLPRPTTDDHIKEYWRYCSQVRIPSGCPYGGGSHRIEAFRQLLGLGINPPSLWTLRAAFLEDSLDDCQAGREIITEREMRQEISSVCQDWIGDVNRRLFITHLGYFAAGPATVQQNDLVVIPFGSNVPVILRQVGDSYYLVEECYVQGFMDGTVFELSDYGGRECREFCVV